ncbi:unnamed protein product [Prorocentrum cordatum]|uniref:Uncharacterized protein n=1 Tax=Prorocentrum cordatum TaxID=2364126 RepID=A0ABN9UM47_9DINO|nr:unnamed protein product [Polarella glacialis]
MHARAIASHMASPPRDEELEAGAASLEEQLEHTREQCQATSSENRRRAIQLSGEQGRTKRMHDEFVLLQAELFARPTGQRGVRPEPPPEAAAAGAAPLPPPPPTLLACCQRHCLLCRELDTCFYIHAHLSVAQGHGSHRRTPARCVGGGTCRAALAQRRTPLDTVETFEFSANKTQQTSQRKGAG